LCNATGPGVPGGRTGWLRRSGPDHRHGHRPGHPAQRGAGRSL